MYYVVEIYLNKVLVFLWQQLESSFDGVIFFFFFLYIKERHIELSICYFVRLLYRECQGRSKKNYFTEGGLSSSINIDLLSYTLEVL